MSTIESSDVSSASMATEAFVRRLDEQDGAGGCSRNDVFLAPQEGGAQDLDTDAFIRHIAAQVDAVERKSAAATDSIFSETSPMTNTATTTAQQQGGGASATVTREALIQQLYDMAMRGQLGGASSSEHMNDDEDDEGMESDKEEEAEDAGEDDDDKDFSFDDKDEDSDDVDSTINFKRDSDSPSTDKKPAKKPVVPQQQQKAAADWSSSESSEFPSPSFSMSATSFAPHAKDTEKNSSESPAVLDLASTPYEDDEENSDSFGLSVTTPYDFSDAYTLDSPTVTLTDTPKTKPKRKSSKKKASKKKASKKKASKKK